jgi:hypothetical protein
MSTRFIRLSIILRLCFISYSQHFESILNYQKLRLSFKKITFQNLFEIFYSKTLETNFGN